MTENDFLNDKLIQKKLQIYFKANGIAAYKISVEVLNKSPSYLSNRLNTRTLNLKDFMKIVNHLNISYEFLKNYNV